MALKSGIAVALGALLATGCGQATDTQEASTPPDAEAPYAEAAAPPSHAEVAAVVELENASGPDAAAFMEAANKLTVQGGKVSNVTDAVSNDVGSIKAIAATDETSDDADEGGADIFGGIVGDADRGKRLFAQCQACHSVDEGQNRVGPSLYNVVGSPSGAVDGFRYSDANANAGIVWTEDALFAFLEDPREYMPGTRMFYPGVPKPQDRADIIAYLGLQTD